MLKSLTNKTLLTQFSIPLVGAVGGTIGRTQVRHQIERQLHLDAVLLAVLVGQAVGAGLAAHKVSLDPLEHREHGVRRREPALGRGLDDLGVCDAERRRHSLEGL